MGIVARLASKIPWIKISECEVTWETGLCSRDHCLGWYVYRLLDNPKIDKEQMDAADRWLQYPFKGR